MASTAGESATTILCSCKQTRFHIESPVYQELDIEGLNITVTSGGGSTAKGKGKAKAEGLEILANATLKLKAGTHYALIGRNGTGKSTILRAVSEKLIPGIPLKTRISILQQIAAAPETTSDPKDLDSSQKPGFIGTNSSVLETVINRATSKIEIQREIDVLSKAVDTPEDAYASLRAYRSVKHNRLKEELFEKDKDARLRSGTRGMAARKALIAFEKLVAESSERLSQTNEDITDEALREETQAATDLLTELQSQLEPAKLAEIETTARSILAGLGFSKTNLEKSVASLSGGWRMRTNLAAVLLSPTDILILDEPTNFLDLLGIIWLQRFLIRLKESSNSPTVIIVSHDRDFINIVCDELIILRDQILTYHRGDLITYEKSIRDKKLYLGRMKDAQEKQKTHIQQTIQQNMKQGKATGDDNKLRQAKSRQKKLDNRMGMEKSAKGGRFKLNRDLVGFHLTAREEIDIPADERGVSILLPKAPDLRFPGPLVSLEKVTFKYTPVKKIQTPLPIVLQDIDLTIHMGDRVGIVGLNGCGKSTLIKLITETTKPTKGAVTCHPRLRMGYYSQHEVEELQKLGFSKPDLTALALLTQEVEGVLNEGELRGLLGSLGLPGRTASDVPLTKLSGGQLVRLALARLLWKEPQLLVLDEITTHLDYHTVTALADALSYWNGAVLVVSHDRFLIRRVVQGEKDDVDSEDEDEDTDEEEELRRRTVFLLKGGVLKVLDNGVTGFEESLEKRVKKLLAD